MMYGYNLLMFLQINLYNDKSQNVLKEMSDIFISTLTDYKKNVIGLIKKTEEDENYHYNKLS